jgi:hypothetical protein
MTNRYGVIPAPAGIQSPPSRRLDASFRWHDDSWFILLPYLLNNA